MKPKADEDDILLGSEAAQHVIETWHDVCLGMVETEVIGPWFIVRRGGGDYSAFISLVDDTMVTILHYEATTRHIPEEHRPDRKLSERRTDLLEGVFSSASGGMFPKPDEMEFAIGFRDGDTHKQLKIGMLEDGVWVDEA